LKTPPVCKCRSSYCADQSGVIHPRDEILRVVDCLGEPGEAGAFAQEFRAHRDDHMQGDARGAFALVCGLCPRNEIDEQLRLVSSHLLFEAKELLELIDEHADAFALDPFERGGDGGERRRKRIELASDVPNPLGIAGSPLQSRKFSGKVPKRPARRPHGAGKPGRTMALVLEGELGKDACAHQRGLPGTGNAMDKDETVLCKTVDDLVDHPLAPKEN
jgi:hypothetical protein